MELYYLPVKKEVKKTSQFIYSPVFAFYAYTYLASNDSWIQHTGKSLEHALVQCHEPNNVANTYV